MPSTRVMSAICELQGGAVFELDPNKNIEEQIDTALLNSGMMVTKEDIDSAITTLAGATATTILFILPIPGSKVTGGVKVAKIIFSTIANYATYKGAPSAIEILGKYLEQYGFKRAFSEGMANVHAIKYYTQFGRIWDSWDSVPYIYKFSINRDRGRVETNITNSEIIDWCDWEKEKSA